MHVVIAIAAVILGIGALVKLVALVAMMATGEMPDSLLAWFVVPAGLLIAFGPLVVLVSTELMLVASDGLFWDLRRSCWFSFWQFGTPLVVLVGLFAMYLATLRISKPVVRFVALALARLTALFGMVVASMYAVILLRGEVMLLGYWYRFRAGQPFGFSSIVDDLPFILVALVGTVIGVALAATPVIAFARGIRLSHRLFRYYYPWELRRQKTLWPDVGYSLERAGGSERIDVLIASDLHVTEPGAETLEPQMAAVAIEPLGRLTRLADTKRPAVLLITGDLTDSGSPAQWDRVADELRPSCEIVAIPGNHDYHFRHVAQPSRFGAFFGPASFRSAEVYKQLARRSAVSTVPMLHHCKDLELDILAMDSNLRPSGWSVTNAVGSVGPRQLELARSKLQGRDRSRPLLVALHHHIIPPPFSLNAPFLLCLDRDEVLGLALEYGAKAIVHGHTHQPFVYRHSSGLLIISCGSGRFTASGRYADDVQGPSYYGVTLEGGELVGVRLLQPAAVN